MRTLSLYIYQIMFKTSELLYIIERERHRETLTHRWTQRETQKNKANDKDHDSKEVGSDVFATTFTSPAALTRMLAALISR